MIEPSASKAHPWLTVGIAAYNSAAYIRTALHSVIKQTDERVAVIVVNDGSTDNTLHEIKELVNSYDPGVRERITIVDQPNSGVSVVRNVAIERATTPYITFLDGDDYWLDDYYETVTDLVENAGTADIDLVEYNALEDRRLVDPDKAENRILEFNPLGNYSGELLSEHLRAIFINSKWYSWTRVYNMELFREASFPAGLRYEDLMLTPLLYLKARHIVATKKALVGYRTNPNGQVSNPSRQSIEAIEKIIHLHLAMAKSSEGLKKELLILLVCQSLLFYKKINIRKYGYFGALPYIRNFLNRIKPSISNYPGSLPFRTRLLFLSPAASNLYSYIKARPALTQVGRPRASTPERAPGDQHA